MQESSNVKFLHKHAISLVCLLKEIYFILEEKNIIKCNLLSLLFCFPVILERECVDHRKTLFFFFCMSHLTQFSDSYLLLSIFFPSETILIYQLQSKSISLWRAVRCCITATVFCIGLLSYDP